MTPPSGRYRCFPLYIAVILLAVSFLTAVPLRATAGADDGAPSRTIAIDTATAPAATIEQALEKLENTHHLFPLNEKITRNLADGYSAYGRRFFQKRQYEQADDLFRKGQELFPEDASFALLRGVSNYYLKRYDSARTNLELTRSLGGDSPETLYFLGHVLYDTDNRQQAMELWEQALKLAPGRKEISTILAKARKESAVEGKMDQGYSSRFDLSYDHDVDVSFALSILELLETAASAVNSELDHYPRARVPVSIYKRNDYRIVTDSPDWSGGLYDGKIRLPFGAARELTPVMRAALFHEYAHVVVFDLTHGNCPLWLNEGIAEMFGRSQDNHPLTELEHALQSGAIADFKKLEKSFSGLSKSEAILAYQQSYSMVNYLATTFGWHRIKRILLETGNGASIDNAIATALADYNLTYDGLIGEWRDHIARSSREK